jgi:hypothetical protein
LLQESKSSLGHPQREDKKGYAPTQTDSIKLEQAASNDFLDSGFRRNDIKRT